MKWVKLMKNYDRKKPLIVIHLPKAGGTSFGKILRQWYGNKYYGFYYNLSKGKIPKKVRLKKFFSNQFREGICIHGHFNKNRGVGIKKYYPEVDQFITIIRDPFEMAVSEYVFLKKTGKGYKDKLLDKDIEIYLTSCTPNILSHFPFDLTMDNYKDLLEENFIHIGITEDMDTSTRIIGEKLGFTIFPNVEILNKTERIQRVPYELKKAFIEKHPVEYAVYEFAKANYNKY